MSSKTKYTCQEYREEMTLLGLKRRLEDSCLSKEEREAIIAEIKRLEVAMGMN